MPIIRYLEVSIRRDSGKLDKFEKFERNLVLYLDTIMRFTQNDLFRWDHQPPLDHCITNFVMTFDSSLVCILLV